MRQTMTPIASRILTISTMALGSAYILYWTVSSFPSSAGGAMRAALNMSLITLVALAGILIYIKIHKEHLKKNLLRKCPTDRP